MKISLYTCFIILLFLNLLFPAFAGSLTDIETNHMIDSKFDSNKYNYNNMPAPAEHNDIPARAEYNLPYHKNSGNFKSLSNNSLNAIPAVRCLTKRGSCIVEDKRAAYLEGTRCYCQFDKKEEPLMGTVGIIK